MRELIFRSRSIVRTTLARRRRVIPKIIHQLWIDPKRDDQEASAAPADVVPHVQAWKNHHPGFEHKLWSLGEIRRALPKDDGDELAYLTSSARFPAMKADITRLFLLEHFGGFWIDLKVSPRLSWLNNYTNQDLVLIEHFPTPSLTSTDGFLINSIIGSTPKNEYISRCRAAVSANVKQRIDGSIWNISGPSVLMNTRREYEKENNCDISDSIISSKTVWDELVCMGSDSYNKDGQHWSHREQVEPIYVD